MASRIGRSELAAFLRQVGRRQVHRHVLVGKAEADGVQRVAHALGAFRHRLIGKPDDDERRFARRDAHLHLDGSRLDTDESEGGDLAVHVPPTAAHGRSPVTATT
jgi:hypothetical protein